jgi:hypothetical protein
MCCGSGNAGTQVAVAGEGDVVAFAPMDTTVFTVTYFNGTSEEVVGLEAVRLRIIEPSSRAAGTDENGLQGATYMPRR